MDAITAKLSTVRIAPRKMGLVADEVRGKNINEALTYLKFSPRKRTAQALFGLIKDGHLRIKVGNSYPLSDAAKAHSDLVAGRTLGSVVLIP